MFVPVRDADNTEFSVNLDRCNYIEHVTPRSGHHINAILHFAGSDCLEVKETRDEILSMKTRLNKGK